MVCASNWYAYVADDKEVLFVDAARVGRQMAPIPAKPSRDLVIGQWGPESVAECRPLMNLATHGATIGSDISHPLRRRDAPRMCEPEPLYTLQLWTRLSPQPLADAHDRIGARSRIGADMRAARTVGAVGKPGEQAQRIVRAIEVVIGVRIDDDRGLRGAAAGAGDHLLARRRRRPIIGAAGQNQGRDAGAPGRGGEAPAARIERHRGTEVGHAVTRQDAGPHRPKRS